MFLSFCRDMPNIAVGASMVGATLLQNGIRLGGLAKSRSERLGIKDQDD